MSFRYTRKMIWLHKKNKQTPGTLQTYRTGLISSPYLAQLFILPLMTTSHSSPKYGPIDVFLDNYLRITELQPSSPLHTNISYRVEEHRSGNRPRSIFPSTPPAEEIKEPAVNQSGPDEGAHL